ncbi:LysE family translocator [Kitasatospora sp. NPDC054939]
MTRWSAVARKRLHPLPGSSGTEVDSVGRGAKFGPDTFGVPVADTCGADLRGARAGLTSVIAQVLPGPDTLLVVRSGLRGRRQAIAVGLGTAVAAFGWGLAAAVGVAALLQHSAAAFTAVKLAGAAYLIFLGVRTFWRTRQGQVSTTPTGTQGHDSAWRAARTGLVAGLLNPKTGRFYVAVLPQIIPGNETVLASTLLFATVDALVVASTSSSSPGSPPCSPTGCAAPAPFGSWNA